MTSKEKAVKPSQYAGDMAAAMLVAAVMVAGVVLAYASHFPLIPWLGNFGWGPGWGLIGMALFVSLVWRPLRRNLMNIWVVCIGLLLMIVCTLLPLQPSTAPVTNSPYTFTLDASKIKSDLSAVPSNGNIEVILLVNNQEYRYKAQVFQMSKNGTPASCMFGTSSTTKTIPASATPCLNKVVDTVSITLADSSLLDSFVNELPNVSTIYLLPA